LSFSRNSVRRALAAAATLACLAVPRFANALELKVWPLVDVERSAALTRIRVLGPLFEWRNDRDTTTLALRPLWRSQVVEESGNREGSLLYPVARWKRTEGSFAVRFFGLVSYERRTEPTPTAPAAREFTVFPFVFFRQSPETGTSLSVVPFYANLPRLLGYERVQMVLFPLYLRLVEPLSERRWLPFPFLSRVGGRLGSGFRAWPLFGHTVIGSRSETRYFVWPFWIRHVEHPGRDGQVTTRISWPLFSLVDGPQIQSRTFGYLLILPLYTRTLDRKNGTETAGFPWPFWTIQRETATGERSSIRLAPLYQDRRTAVFRSVFYLWPFYRWRQGLGDASGYERTDVLFVLYRDQHEGEDEATRRHTRVVLPLRISRSDDDDARSQTFTLLDGLFPKNEELEALWAPLYRIYATETSGVGTRRDVLWRMWEWGGGRHRPPLYLSRG
jgi:hypothetical protein